MIQRYNYQFILIFTILTLIGIVLVPLLTIQLNPSTSSANIVISFSMPNTSPEVLEKQVTSKIEGALSTLQGIRKVSSSSMYNHGYVTVELEKQVNIDQIRFEVAMLVRQVYVKLPKETSYPLIQLNSPDENKKQEPLMTIRFSGSGELHELNKFAEDKIKPLLTSLKEIYEINIVGGNQLEWVISYRKILLDELNITESEIIEAIRNHFSQQSLGITSDNKGQSINVILDNTNRQLFKWQIPIQNHNGRIIYLTDVAHIYEQERPITHIYRINGTSSVNLVIIADRGANQINLSRQIRSTLETVKGDLPQSYQLTIEHDSSEFIFENLQKIGIQAFLSIIILLIFVWVAVRKWWYLGLISLSLLVNLAISFILFYILKVEIHLYSLAAITTSLGIIIDNTIVMIDHYSRYRNLKVIIGLFGATLTTAAGLIVIFFLPEKNRFDLTDFALVMLITLIVSLPVALLFVPSVLERIEKKTDFLKSHNSLRFKIKINRFYQQFIVFVNKHPVYAYLFAILFFGLPVFLLPDKIDKDYFGANLYNTVFDNEWYQETMKPKVNKYLGGTLRLFADYVYEGSYFQSPERTALHIHATLPNNTTITQIDDIFKRFENSINQYKEVDKYITNVYSGQNGLMSIYFTPEAQENGFAYKIKSKIIQISNEMSGVEWSIYGVGQGFSQNTNDTEIPTFRIKMVGYNYNELEKQATDLKNILEKHPRIQEVNINTSVDWVNNKNLFEYSFKSPDNTLALNQISKQQLSIALNQQSSEPQPDLYLFLENEYVPLKVTPLESYGNDLWLLKNRTIKFDSTYIRLKDFSTITKDKIMPEIVKEGQQYIRMISFVYYGNSTFGEEFLDKTLTEFNSKMQIGFKAEKQNFDWHTKNVESRFWLIGVVFLMIYTICAIIFESLSQPLAIVLIIPLSFIGVFLTFYWFDFNFDQGGYASFILLSGNVVCAAIFIITEFNILKKKYVHLTELNLYTKAFNHKIIPIFYTILSTIVGLIPFLFFGEKEVFWFALGVGTIGGLVMSILVIIIYLPLFLKLKI